MALKETPTEKTALLDVLEKEGKVERDKDRSNKRNTDTERISLRERDRRGRKEGIKKRGKVKVEWVRMKREGVQHKVMKEEERRKRGLRRTLNREKGSDSLEYSMLFHMGL